MASTPGAPPRPPPAAEEQQPQPAAPPQQQDLPPENEAVHQAGGGVSGDKLLRRSQIKAVSATVLPYLDRVFKSRAGDEGSWHCEQAATFIRCTQAGDPKAPADGLPAELTAKVRLDFADFIRYMTSDASNAVGPLNAAGDLSYPLCSYFISSSHNTYLTGNQLSSDASTDAYKNVLLRGCRCIEIDVWDGDDSDSDDDGYSSSDLEDDDPKKAQIHARKAEIRARRKEKVAKAKSKIPKSMLDRLEKTSLGRKLEKFVDKKTEPVTGSAPPAAADEKHAAAAAAAAAAATSSPSVAKVPSPEVAAIEPRVFHGYTLTGEVSFRDVCTTIKEYAFAVTDLPLIVSLEVHAGAAQQEIMVKIMKQVWKGLLVDPPDKETTDLPAPNELLRRILVKVKYAPPGQDVAAVSDEETSSTSGQLAPEAAAKKNKKPSKIIHALSDLGVYMRAVSFKSLVQPEAAMPAHVFSLGEKTVREVHEKESLKLFEHNRKYLMRAYPSGFRIGSSNLDPAQFWRKGIQIAALNWQNWDEGMMLNEAMFAGSGGYVLKPEGYRCAKPNTPEDKSHVQHRTLDLEIKVLAAQNLPLPPETSVKSFNPYLKVELHVEAGGERHGHFPHDGHACDPATEARARAAQRKSEGDDDDKEGEYKARTKTVKATCDPDFKGELLEFKTIPGVVEELSFVRFIVRDDEKFRRDDLAAWACVRLDRLRLGYRFVRLMDTMGRETEGVVLVKIIKKVY
ncbi:unnamed protein product [Discula destructiva]